ncbi:hypothetical protein R2E40_10155 [Aeromonas sp. CD]|uniref:hypothetical protein n=1 Tax=Aeromonas sp. CD TaxID=3080830 RepID=UPI002967402A|nr:hypothetical protein [Aeromonas sp. CD]WOX54451.1 hypothetical protein R2E40_10155 [Aeromonas sp. CD]
MNTAELMTTANITLTPVSMTRITKAGVFTVSAICLMNIQANHFTDALHKNIKKYTEALSAILGCTVHSEMYNGSIVVYAFNRDLGDDTKYLTECLHINMNKDTNKDHIKAACANVLNKLQKLKCKANQLDVVQFETLLNVSWLEHLKRQE